MTEIKKGKKSSKLDSHLGDLSFYSLIGGSLIGFCFTILFLWKEPGISVPLFTVLLVLLFNLPSYFLSGFDEIRPKLRFTTIFWLLSSLIFLYRLDGFVITIAVLSYPIIYSYVFASSHSSVLEKGATGLSLLFSPIVLLINFLSELVNFVTSLTSRNVVNPERRKHIFKVLLGLVISMPILGVFILLFSQADPYFAEKFTDAIEFVFGNIFDDFASFVEFIFKVVIGQLFGFYLMVTNFGFWSKDSKFYDVTKGLEKYLNPKLKQNVDALVTNIIFGSISLLFLVFILFQFIYLFGGVEQVVGESATYTYSEYLRRGFVELLVAVFFSVFLLTLFRFFSNVKQSAVGRYSQIISSLIILFGDLVIMLSAFERLRLTIDEYGYTLVRMWGFVIILSTVLSVVLMARVFVFSLGYKALSRSINWGFALMFCILLFAPLDGFVARLNFDKYQDDGRIDLEYISALSKDATLAKIDIVESGDLPEDGEIYMRAALQKDAIELENSRNTWPSFSFGSYYYQNKIEDLNGDEDYIEQNFENAQEQVGSYYEVLFDTEVDDDEIKDEIAQFNEVDQELVDELRFYYEFVEVRDVDDSYDGYVYPTDSADEILNYENQNLKFATGGRETWGGSDISREIVLKPKLRIERDTGYDRSTLVPNKEYCMNVYSTVLLENGEWKLLSTTSGFEAFKPDTSVTSDVYESDSETFSSLEYKVDQLKGDLSECE